MRILIAEDEPVSRRLTQAMLTKAGHDVIAVCDGTEAWDILRSGDPPRLAVLDWMMPGISGLEVCQRVCGMSDSQPTYIIMLTVRDHEQDIVAGLHAGADDYITKPFHRGEFCARVQVGVRIVELQMSLEDRVRELEDAFAEIKQLQGFLPICSYCKKIRDDQDYWRQVEDYVTEHSEARFTHSVCPDCYKRLVRPELTELNWPGAVERDN